MASSERRASNAGGNERQPRRGRSRHAAIGFWSVVGILFAVTTTLGVIAIYRSEDTLASTRGTRGDASTGGDIPAEPTEVDVPPTTVGEWIEKAARSAEQATVDVVAPSLEEAFEPVYAAIPMYADFHYSVVGEYTELAQAALAGRMSRSLEERLFAGLEQRVQTTTGKLDRLFIAAYETAIAEQLEEYVPEGLEKLPLSKATEVALNDAIDRATVGKPISLAVATGAGAASMKVIAGMIGKKLAAKTAIKLASRGTTMGGGAATGAAIGAFLGPVGMAAGGALGGAVAWFAADAVVVNVDEWLNREDFEKELRGLVDAEKARLQDTLEAQVREKADRVAGQTIKQVQDSSSGR